jgi:hypothetical protein
MIPRDEWPGRIVLAVWLSNWWVVGLVLLLGS